MNVENKDTLTAYLVRIKENIKLLHRGQLPPERGQITKRYNLHSFKNNFIAIKEVFEEQDNLCICGHAIFRNYKYYHKRKGKMNSLFLVIVVLNYFQTNIN